MNMSKEDRELDEDILEIGKALIESDTGTYVANPKRVKEFSRCYSILKELFGDSGATIRYEQQHVFTCVGAITVYATKLATKDTKRLNEALSLSTNWELYPRTDGKLVLALSFYDMARKVGE